MTDQRDPTRAAAGPSIDSGSLTRIVIQSTDRLRRELLAAHLDTIPEFSVVGRVARYEDAFSLCVLEHPGIVLLDAGQQLHEAVAGCRLIRDRFQAVSVAVTCAQLTLEQLTAFRLVGVDALVPYAHGLTAVVDVLRGLATGRPADDAPKAGLSHRQREILLLMASGHSATEIAELLGIRPGTVESHKRQVYAKLGVASALQAVARAASYGIVDGDHPPDEPARAGTETLPAPAAGWLPIAEVGRAVVTVVAGGHPETLDRVVTTLISRGLPVLRDHAPSWAEPVHALRWHRGRVARVLVDPAPDHWRIAAAAWRCTVVVRSRHSHIRVTSPLANGAAALLHADHIEDHLVPALMLVAQGYTVMDGNYTRSFVHDARMGFAGRELQKPTLTDREYDILVSIGRSLTVRQTARRLGIAVKTVENTQVHLFRKLGVRSRAEALAVAYSLGLLRTDPTQ